MNLFRETGGLVVWLLRIAGVFLRSNPVTTVIVVATTFTSLIAGMLAVVLPLKIILLVASDGVSKWFQPFVGPEGKDALVLVLVVTAIVSFFASIVLDALAERLSGVTGYAVSQGSNELAVVGNQEEEARTHFSRFAGILAGVLFSMAGFAVVGVVNPLLIGILLATVFAQFLFTAAVLAWSDQIDPRGLARFISRDPGDYLKILSSVNFLIVFAVLLYPFVWGSGGDAITALVSVIVMRRVLGTTVQACRSSIKMRKRRQVIDTLVFRERQLEQGERRDARTLREVFGKEARQQRVAEVLRSVGVEPDRLDVRWEDSRLPGISVLAVTNADGAGIYRQQIYLPRNDHRLENETVLFSHVSRGALGAPTVLARFSEGPFECQLCDAGAGDVVEESEWPTMEAMLVSRLCALSPPKELVRALTLSRPLLTDRLSRLLIDRLEVAVDTPDEAETFERLRDRLTNIQDALKRCPLCILNPEIKQPNVLLDHDGEPLVMTWGKWTLEPVGAGLPAGFGRQKMEQLAKSVSASRSDLPEGFGVDHLELAAVCWKLESQIQRNLFKAGLASVERLLENPLLSTDESPAGAESRCAGGNA